jgi:signal transduction histidine kinase
MKKTILIVDDTPANVRILVSCLTAAHYGVLVAEDGASALELISNEKPDLILLDVMMPVMDGFETCQWLKQNPQTRDIPVLFTTAVGDCAAKMKGFEIGAVDYITKPFHLSEVLARVKVQLTLIQQKKDLEAALAQQNKFMRIAAHDLRNPLFAILSWAEIGNCDAIAADQQDFAMAYDRIRTAGIRMQNLINDFLSLQVLQEGEGQERMSDFNLNHIVGQVLDQNEFSANAKNIVIHKRLQPDLPQARGDESFTHQIAANYVSNAIKYSPWESDVHICTCLCQDTIRLEVKDHGPGIPAADRDRLFVEFARLSTKPTGGEAKTGLGLSIVKHLAERQGGKVGAEFPPEGGSVFWFELPHKG